MSCVPVPEADPLDYLFDRRLRLRQLPKGHHRAGTDTVLLAAAAPWPVNGPVIDLGCGVGSAGLAVALFDPAAQVVLVDCDSDSLTLAAENAARNGVASRTTIVKADILGPAAACRAAGLLPNMAALVLTNPPFAESGRVRASPNASRRQAHVLPDGGLERWIRTACAVLRPGGAMVMIHRADALPLIMAGMARRFGAVQVRPIQPRTHEVAHRVLVRGIRGSRAPFALLPPLILHEPDGAMTAESAAIHRGDRRIGWQAF